MRVYEAQLSYQLRELGDARPLNQPEQVAEYLSSAFGENPTQEAFWVILLNRKNYPMARTRITLGTLTSSLVHPREVFKAAILASAASVIAAHNHPSGDPSPSAADLQVTRQLREAARVIDIDFLDHVIVGDPKVDPTGRGLYSFRDAGLL